MPVKLECKKDDKYYRVGIGKWAWDQDMGQLRIRETDKCPSTFRNGNVSRNCHLQPGAECSFNCDLGCDKDPTVSILHRGLSGRWNEKTENLCTNCRRCPNSIVNGSILSSSCEKLPSSSCSFTCDYGCRKAVGTLYCNSEGEWDIANPCVCSAEEMDTDDAESSSSGIVVIVVCAVAGVLVFVFILAMAWCIHRRRMNLQAAIVREHTVTVPMITPTAPPGDSRSATAHSVHTPTALPGDSRSVTAHSVYSPYSQTPYTDNTRGQKPSGSFFRNVEPTAHQTAYPASQSGNSHGLSQYRADETSGQPPSYEQVLSDPSRFKT